jgi:hypothetical protein
MRIVGLRWRLKRRGRLIERGWELNSGVVGPMGFFFGGGARAVFFRQTNWEKNFPDENILIYPPPRRQLFLVKKFSGHYTNTEKKNVTIAFVAPFLN